MGKRTQDAGSKRPVALWQRLGGEFAGTFALTFAAAGADVMEYLTGGAIGHVARYLSPAIVVMAMIWSLSGVSGAHINPAVTWAFFLRRSFPLARVPGYVAMQLLGAIAAALVLRALFGEAIQSGITKPDIPFSATQAASMETLLTFFLVYVILATTQEKAVVGKNSALAVGGIVAMCGLAFSPVSGASMNPARSLGPMVASLNFENVWVYIAGPLIGAALAVAVVWILYGEPTSEEGQ